MGMFDYVKVEYPLPQPEHNALVWQTKDTPLQFLAQYTVTREGRLVLPSVFAGKGKRSRGIDLNWHGNLFLIGGDGPFIEYRLYFDQAGKVEMAEQLEDAP